MSSQDPEQNPKVDDVQAQKTPMSETLSPRLAALNRVTMKLTRSSSVDELLQDAIRFGIQELDFDRLGLFLTDENNPYHLHGTYGIDPKGVFRDEHHVTFQLTADDWLMALVDNQSTALYVVVDDTALLELNAENQLEAVGTGWNAGAALWDGEQIIGYLLCDNLLRQRPYTDVDGELLTLYAGTIGHLCLRLRVEETLRDRHQQEYRFRTRLAKLNYVAAELFRASDVDQLYRGIVELGRSEIGFDRLGLWLYGEDRTQLMGTYGTWLDGTLKSERHLTQRAEYYESKLQVQLERGPDTSTAIARDLTTPESDVVGHGWWEITSIYDGDNLIGYLSTDNLLQQQPYHEFDGELLRAYGNMIGPLITRQRLAERIQEQQADYQALLNAIPDMLFILTKDGVYRQYYAPEDKTLYVPPEVFLGKHISEVLPSPLWKEVMQAIEKVNAGADCVTLEYTLPGQDELLSFDGRFVPINDGQVMALVRNITDRKHLEEQLIISQKMESLGRMASGIAHDFNNVLTVIQGYSSMIQWQLEKTQSPFSSPLTKIVDATDKGMRLTQQLLSFARKQVVTREVIDVCIAVAKMETMIRQILGDEIAYRFQDAKKPLYIKIDPGQFEQILLNMAVNARDAMTKGDTFSIVCEQIDVSETEAQRYLKADPGIYVVIRIQDTGTGIQEEHLTQIFEPFFTTKPGEKGSGLGLAICHGIVAQSGGYILVESMLAEGTEFQIYLPSIEATSTPSQPMAYRHSAARGETVLIVEDDPIVCELATDILRGSGYTVLHYTSGVDALRRAQEYPGKIDLLMTDMMMPQMNGVELAEAMMRLRPELPVLMVSGYAGDLPEQFVQSANVKFLAKPYKADELTTHVRNILYQP